MQEGGVVIQVPVDLLQFIVGAPCIEYPELHLYVATFPSCTMKPLVTSGGLGHIKSVSSKVEPH